MNKLLKATLSILLIVTVWFTGCNKPDEPNNGGDNGNNGGNTPETPAIVSTSEVQYDGIVYIETVFDDETKMYFEIVSPKEVSVVNGEFYYQDNPSLAYIYRGEVVIPESILHLGTTYSVVSIAKKAFSENEMITSVFIPNSIYAIESYYQRNTHNDYVWDYYGAFQGCSNLNNVHLSENIEIIGINGFAGCPCFKESVTIPKQVIELGACSFCSQSVVFNADSCTIAGSKVDSSVISAFPYMNSIVFCDNIKVLPAFLYAKTGFTSIELPSSISTIPDSFFFECSKLERVENLDQITSIGCCAFYGCTALTSIELSNSLETINEDAFHGCTSLTEISFPGSITIIKDYAFNALYDNCNISIDTRLTCTAIKPPLLGRSVFLNRNIQVIYVPMSSVEAYKTADGWRRYADVIVGI